MGSRRKIYGKAQVPKKDDSSKEESGKIQKLNSESKSAMESF